MKYRSYKPGSSSSSRSAATAPASAQELYAAAQRILQQAHSLDPDQSRRPTTKQKRIKKSVLFDVIWFDVNRFFDSA